jgi:hypothetical protein
LAFQLWISNRHYLPGRPARLGAFLSHGLVSEEARPPTHGAAANE